MAQQPSAARVEANLFELSGGNIHVDYSTTSLTGDPILGYHDGSDSISFRGDAIETIKTSVGTLVTVVLKRVPDLATTRFSVLVPDVSLSSAGFGEPVKTVGITTIERSSFFGQPVGQRDSYMVQELKGTAQFVLA